MSEVCKWFGFHPRTIIFKTSEGKRGIPPRAQGRSPAPARAEWARAQSTRGEKRAAREAPRLSLVGSPLSRAAHGFSPTARGGRLYDVVKQVKQKGKEGYNIKFNRFF